MIARTSAPVPPGDESRSATSTPRPSTLASHANEVQAGRRATLEGEGARTRRPDRRGGRRPTGGCRRQRRAASRRSGRVEDRRVAGCRSPGRDCARSRSTLRQRIGRRERLLRLRFRGRSLAADAGPHSRPSAGRPASRSAVSACDPATVPVRAPTRRSRTRHPASTGSRRRLQVQAGVERASDGSGIGRESGRGAEAGRGAGIAS